MNLYNEYVHQLMIINERQSVLTSSGFAELRGDVRMRGLEGGVTKSIGTLLKTLLKQKLVRKGWDASTRAYLVVDCVNDDRHRCTIIDLALLHSRLR
jgi:hypothetical protein